jgi:Fe-Mn family superoxide dismutase
MTETFELPDLPYDYDALEPHIDERTMRIHHDKHHAGYTRKLNNAVEGHDDLQARSAVELLRNLNKVPDGVRTAVRQNGGGYVNHSLFWKVMSPNGGGKPDGELADRLQKEFGSFKGFKQRFNEEATGRFGSGWAWLVVDANGELSVYNTLNQNSPYLYGDTPVLGLDVWEHAYYLNYQNERGTYVKKFWNVVNWEHVQNRYKQAMERF